MLKKLITLILVMTASSLFADREEMEPTIFNSQVTFSNGIAIVIGGVSRTNWPNVASWYLYPSLGIINFGGYRGTNAATPVGSNDVANKSYVDSSYTNLQAQINSLSSSIFTSTTAITYDAYVTNNWRFPSSGVSAIMPFGRTNAYSSAYFSTNKYGLVPQKSGFYEICVSVHSTGNNNYSIYLLRVNASSTNVLQSAGTLEDGQAVHNMLYLNAIIYDNGSGTNWYPVRVTSETTGIIAEGSTNGPTRYVGHYIGQ